LAAQGFAAAQGFFVAQGLALSFFVFALAGCFAAQGFFPAQGLALLIWRERAAQGLAAPHGAAMAAPLMAAASAPDEIRDFAIVLSFMLLSSKVVAWPEWRMRTLVEASA
jgi:hypothetical protein